MNKITTNLWFNGNAEEAVDFYLGVFNNSKIIETTYYSDVGKEFHGKEKGDILTITFILNEMEFVAINAGPEFKFNPSVSFSIDCKDQEEVDYYWDLLLEGGKASMCGWLEDKFGLSWQIIPVEYYGMLRNANEDQRRRIDEELFKEVKLDIEKLRKAYSGK